jgi:hypothetical protein
LKKRAREEYTITDFFLNMAQTVKTFPPFLQAQVKNKVFSAVNSAELLMYNLENPWRNTETNEYSIPSTAYARQSLLHPPAASHVATAADSGPQSSAHASLQFDAAFSDHIDQKPVVANLVSRNRNCPSTSLECESTCDTARFVATHTNK